MKEMKTSGSAILWVAAALFLFLSIEAAPFEFRTISGEPVNTLNPLSIQTTGPKPGSVEDYRHYDSNTCLSCHDGVAAKDAHVNPGGQESYKNRSIGMSHPVKVDYSSSMLNNPGLYNPPESLHPGIKLFNGSVECLTCHDPGSPNKDHLVMSNARSALCLSCHNL